jgi:hypothetical protein
MIMSLALLEFVVPTRTTPPTFYEGTARTGDLADLL